MILAVYNSYSEGLRDLDIFRYFRDKDQSQDYFKNLSYTDTELEGDNTKTENKQQSIDKESTGKDNQNSEVWIDFIKIAYHIKSTAKKVEVLNHTQICQNCDVKFASNNLLHKHLIICKESRKWKQRTYKLSVSNKVILKNKKKNSV